MKRRDIETPRDAKHALTPARFAAIVKQSVGTAGGKYYAHVSLANGAGDCPLWSSLRHRRPGRFSKGPGPGPWPGPALGAAALAGGGWTGRKIRRRQRHAARTVSRRRLV